MAVHDSMTLPAAAIVLVTILCVTGCVRRDGPFNVTPLDGHYHTVPRVMWMRTTTVDDEAHALAHELEQRPRAADVATVLERAEGIIANGNFETVNGLMTANVAVWARLYGHQRDVLPLVRQCLGHPDRLIRWVGIVVANELGYEQAVHEALLADFVSLLIRPEPIPWWAVAPGREYVVRSHFRIMGAASAAGCRRQVIELLGVHRIVDARPVLEAIRSDPWEWDRSTREATEVALSKLEADAAGDTRTSRHESVHWRSNDEVENRAPADRDAPIIVQ